MGSHIQSKWVCNELPASCEPAFPGEALAAARVSPFYPAPRARIPGTITKFFISSFSVFDMVFPSLHVVIKRACDRYGTSPSAYSCFLVQVRHHRPMGQTLRSAGSLINQQFGPSAFQLISSVISCQPSGSQAVKESPA